MRAIIALGAVCALMGCIDTAKLGEDGVTFFAAGLEAYEGAEVAVTLWSENDIIDHAVARISLGAVRLQLEAHEDTRMAYYYLDANRSGACEPHSDLAGWVFPWHQSDSEIQLTFQEDLTAACDSGLWPGAIWDMSLNGTAFDAYEGKGIIARLVDEKNEVELVRQRATVTQGGFAITFAETTTTLRDYRIEWAVDVDGSGACNTGEPSWSAHVNENYSPVTVQASASEPLSVGACTALQ